ncbi:hypothetical protein Hanom_Chr16g01419241 [Helianthus anomalus]
MPHVGSLFPAFLASFPHVAFLFHALFAPPSHASFISLSSLVIPRSHGSEIFLFLDLFKQSRSSFLLHSQEMVSFNDFNPIMHPGTKPSFRFVAL